MTEFIEQIPFKKSQIFPSGKTGNPPTEGTFNKSSPFKTWPSPPSVSSQKNVFRAFNVSCQHSKMRWKGLVSKFFLYVKTERDDIIIHGTYSLRKSKVSHQIRGPGGSPHQIKISYPPPPPRGVAFPASSLSVPSFNFSSSPIFIFPLQYQNVKSK